MYTNLDFITEGNLFPPKLEQSRIERYRLHEQLSMTRHPEAWELDFDRLADRLHVKKEKIQTVFNYHQLMTKKICDFICGEPPDIDAGSDSDNLKELLRSLGFFSQLYEGFIDVSRYGNGLLKPVEKRMSVANPMYWTPVVATDDLKRVTNNVIGYPINPDKDGRYTQVYFEMIERGQITTRTVELNPLGDMDPKMSSYYCGKIGKTVKDDTIQTTRSGEFALYPLTNMTYSGSIYGIDDYTAINSIIQKIMWRLHRADTVLDKHSEPSMSGPSSALKHDLATGLYYFDLGNYFKRDSDQDPELKYVTWDGNLDANFKEIELLFQQLYTISEMGQALSDGGTGGAATSARALRLRMVSPLAKAKRIAEMNTATVKSMILALAANNGLDLDPKKLKLTWRDGLPSDETEEVNMLVSATGGKAIMSQKSALKHRGLNDQQAELEMEQMQEEAAASMPPVLGALDMNAQKDAPGGLNDGTTDDTGADR